MTTIGFIGVGVMGRPMADNLEAAGFEVIRHSRSEGPTPAEIAGAVDVVVLMLPDDPAVDEVAGGLLAAPLDGRLVVDMSTVSPALERRLAPAFAERGCDYLDAPVSGGDVGARDATLSIMVGGSAAAFERARPLFEAMGKTITHVGDSGSGQVVKACNQVVVGLTIEAVSEALVLGSKAGVDPATIVAVLSGGLAASRVLELRAPNMIEHSFEPGFKIDLHHKDLGIALATAREHGVALPVTALVDQLLRSLRERGRGGDDHSALITAIEDLAAHRIGGPA